MLNCLSLGFRICVICSNRKQQVSLYDISVCRFKVMLPAKIQALKWSCTKNNHTMSHRIHFLQRRFLDEVYRLNLLITGVTWHWKWKYPVTCFNLFRTTAIIYWINTVAWGKLDQTASYFIENWNQNRLWYKFRTKSGLFINQMIHAISKSKHTI